MFVGLFSLCLHSSSTDPFESIMKPPILYYKKISIGINNVSESCGIRYKHVLLANRSYTNIVVVAFLLAVGAATDSLCTGTHQQQFLRESGILLHQNASLPH